METMTPENKLAVEDTAQTPALKLPKKKRRWVKRLVIAVVVVGVLLAAFRLLGGGKKAQTSGNYLVSAAERRDLTVSVSGTATLAPADSYNVTTLMSGEILSAPFEEGDLVSKDDLLFALDGSDAQSSADRARLGTRQAQLAYQQAKEAVYPTVTQTGTIDEILVKNGDSVTPGTALCRVVSDLDLYIDFLFDAEPAGKFYTGQSVNIYISGFEGSVAGTITSMTPASFLTSTGRDMRTVRVKVTNPGVVSDSRTCYAEVGGYASYGNTSVSYNGASTVYASGSGTVTGLNKMAGSPVTKGEQLCTISSDSNRTQLENARLNVESSKLSENSASEALDNYQINSPIAGTVIEKKFKAGDKVEGMNSGTLAVVYDLSYLKLEMSVDELDIAKISVGQSVEITADAVEGKTFTGRVDKVSINGVTTNGVTTYPVTIVVEEFGDLLPGMNVSARILGESVKNALCIPVDAVSRGNVVLVPGAGAMNADGTGVADPSRVEEKTIALGRNDEEYIEVTSGLEEGDVVLIQNQASDAMQMMMGG